MRDADLKPESYLWEPCVVSGAVEALHMELMAEEAKGLDSLIYYLLTSARGLALSKLVY